MKLRSILNVVSSTHEFAYFLPPPPQKKVFFWLSLVFFIRLFLRQNVLTFQRVHKESLENGLYVLGYDPSSPHA